MIICQKEECTKKFCFACDAHKENISKVFSCFYFWLTNLRKPVIVGQIMRLITRLSAAADGAINDQC